VAENVVVAVGAESAGVAAGHLGHDGLARRRALHAEDSAGELERLPRRPDELVLVGAGESARDRLRRASRWAPASGRHGRIHVHDAVDEHFGAGAETRPVEDTGAGVYEDGIRRDAAREIRVGPTRTWSPRSTGCRVVPRSTACSMTRQCPPMVTGHLRRRAPHRTARGSRRRLSRHRRRWRWEWSRRRGRRFLGRLLGRVPR
jgi:hypothetical protein